MGAPNVITAFNSHKIKPLTISGASWHDYVHKIERSQDPESLPCKCSRIAVSGKRLFDGLYSCLIPLFDWRQRLEINPSWGGRSKTKSIQS